MSALSGLRGAHGIAYRQADVRQITALVVIVSVTRKMAAALQALRAVPTWGLILAAIAYLLACAAVASLLNGMVEWSGPYREVLGVYRSVFVAPLSDSFGAVRGLPAFWDSLYLAILFGALVAGACLRAEYRTYVFLTQQNITNVIGGRVRSPGSAFRMKAWIYAGFVALYALVQVGFAILWLGRNQLLAGFGGDHVFLIYLPASYCVLSGLAVRQTGRRGLTAFPMFSRAEAAGIVCAPWAVVLPVVLLAFMNRMFGL